MPTSRPFAYNTGQGITGASQLGSIAIGVSGSGYADNLGGVKWWNGPDEDLGYIICYPVPAGNQPNPLNVPAYIGFLRSNVLSEASYLDMVNRTFNQSFVDGVNATLYLNNTLQYWTSFICLPSNTVGPVISGTNRIGSTLTTTNGTWTNSPTGYSYQWTRNSSLINGATSSTYALSLADAAAAITCQVTATNGCGNGAVAISNTIKEGSFVSTWDTTKTSVGSSTSTQVTLPLEAGGTYSGVIYWGDGATSGLAFANSTRTYASSGIYTIVVTAAPGSFTGFRFNNSGDILKLSSITQWGTIRLGNNGGFFYGCANLSLSSVSDVLDLTGTTTFINIFRSCAGLTSVANINNWNVSSVTNMSSAFSASAFNQDISGWNTSSVTNMFAMFNNNTSFNQDIGNWNVSGVTNFNAAFQLSRFNNAGSTSIGNWSINSTSSVTMSSMFNNNTSFNQPIGNWNTSKVTDMSALFFFATAFNQNLSNWNVSSVTSFGSMFQNSTAFNNGGATGIGGWVLNNSGSINMSSMFYSASSFNQPLAGWNTSKVTNMGSMFRSATSFNQNVGSWNVTAVSDMSFMFSGASNFNNGGSNTINSWTPSLVTNFNGMFVSSTSFNQPIGGWTLNNSGSPITMTNMFVNAGAFNQNIGAWNVRYVSDFTSFMSSKTPATFSTTNLDAIYSGWSGVTGGVQPSKNISFGTAQYTVAGSAGRAILAGAIASGGYGWTITDGNQV